MPDGQKKRNQPKSLSGAGQIERSAARGKIKGHGGVAQLGEHLPFKQGVRSSILLVSTNLILESGETRLFLENYIEEERRKISQKRNFYALKETNKPKRSR